MTLPDTRSTWLSSSSSAATTSTSVSPNDDES
eukprot:CAMPEP_0178662592 /NCGR_PEP_ID=MMETSP0698-20121128/28342_1 /TAXON_ID=265572 /ORGANISM="Extubocellulus spinifer, Strain CCMP396" /LENGTH=31 /DNA_ID= /DNA_START= /DNA_END= /DNA_ORIENTATION=